MMIYAEKENDNPKTKHGYPGLLIVIEGTDGAGRSTQIQRLREWLAVESYGVVVTEWKSSPIMSPVISEAKDRNLLNATTFSLLYSSDFAHRLENIIIPALKAGLVVLADRYIYTAFARDVVRGISPIWIRKLYGFAPEPDLVFYLKMSCNTLLKRIIATSGLDYHESGMDVGLSTDFYESFKIYQRRILAEYSKMTEEFNFITINGGQSPTTIQTQLRDKIKEQIESGIIE
ncbi:MAG: dTMP kinase [Cyanobacteriota bacterium]